jgi:ubiquitin-small subunit ribosomal protein S27Ae
MSAKKPAPAAGKKEEPAKPAPAAEGSKGAAAPAAAKPGDKAKPKAKKPEKGVHAMYKVESEKVTRARPTCERCGPGYFMADHHNRYTCGHCGFTRYKQK